VHAAGVAGSVDIRLQDYREVDGRFDAIVSVEMIEAVGEEYWPEYFAALDRLLAPGGTVALQSILMSHDRYLTTRRSFGWIQKHIFPGGLIPSADAIATTAAVAHDPAGHRAEPVRTALRGDPQALARLLHRGLVSGQAPGVRRDLPA
jgi:cyclopropane fatty-acyl-phospholipid synthase-like methyltransferase